MHQNLKSFNLDLSLINQIFPNHGLYWDHVGKEAPTNKFEHYYQYGSWLLGYDHSDYYCLFCLAYNECWTSCYPCSKLTTERQQQINADIISLINKHFPGTNGNIANQTWVYLSYIPVEVWDNVNLPENIKVRSNSDYWRNGSEIRIILPDSEHRTDTSNFYICSDVEKYLESTPIYRPDPQYLLHLAFIETEHEDWYM